MSAVTSRVPAAALPQRRKVRRTPRELLERPLIIAGSVGVAMALATLVGPLAGGIAAFLLFAAVAGGLAWYGAGRLRKDL